MSKEDLKKEEKLIGTCKFCGQMKALPDPKEWEAEEPDEEATLKCQCKEGQLYRSREFDLKNAKENINVLFAKFPDDVHEILYKAAIAVEDKIIDKASFKLSEEVTATIKLKNSHIAIERKKLEVTEMETE